MEILNKTSRLLAAPLVFLIWVYQKTISLDHGAMKIFYPFGFCKFHPSCSAYASEVLKKNGIIGLPKIIRRLLMCNPLSTGGVDLPPHQK